MQYDLSAELHWCIKTKEVIFQAPLRINTSASNCNPGALTFKQHYSLSVDYCTGLLLSPDYCTGCAVSGILNWLWLSLDYCTDCDFYSSSGTVSGYCTGFSVSGLLHWLCCCLKTTALAVLLSQDYCTVCAAVSGLLHLSWCCLWTTALGLLFC